MLLSAEHLKKNYGGRELLDDVTLYLNPGDRLGLIGINGTGKSTLLKVLSGDEVPDGGRVARDPNVRLARLAQTPEMTEGMTVMEQVFAGLPDDVRRIHEYEARTILTRLGITDFDRDIATLSGGQRKRVALASVFVEPSDIMVLDEPTNDLDIETLTILEEYLDGFPGAVVAVSHDRYFLDKIAGSIFELTGDGTVRRYAGNYGDYLAQRQAPEKAAAKPRKPAARPTAHADRPRFSFKEQREYETIDSDIAALEAEIARCERDIAANASDYVKLQALTEEKARLDAALEAMMERWVYLNELAEKIAAGK